MNTVTYMGCGKHRSEGKEYTRVMMSPGCRPDKALINLSANMIPGGVIIGYLGCGHRL